MNAIAVILSGCGRADGSEIHESVCTLLALSRRGLPAEIYAPDMAQTQVVNHMNGQNMPESRNVLIEAARIARGNIRPLSELQTDKVSAIILPGGLGAAANLWSYKQNGIRGKIQEDVEHVLTTAMRSKLPLGFICIAPVLGARIAQLCGKRLTLTIGKDPKTAADIEMLGCRHQDSDVHNCVVDSKNRVVSTAAYMSASNIAECYSGIDVLVAAIHDMIP
jgi:enhancing lycopene biosynthesis protein 2